MSILRVQKIRHTASNTDVVDIASDGTCRANIVNNLSNRNLVVNGACLIAQRGVSSTTQNAYTTVDRFKILSGGLDEGVTTAQSDITSGLAYNDGFRKAYKVQNGNQTSGAGTGDYLVPIYRFESQDLANSGWDYVSSSSFITISFYVKSSVAQTFQVQLYNSEPSQSKQYVFEYSATTSWTRITHTVPGNSGLEIDNDVNHGLDLYFNLFHGTASTDNSYVNNQWNNYGGGNPQYKDNTSTWYTTNDATWEITGLQVEVGSVATDFEHRTFADEIIRCERYYRRDAANSVVYYRFAQGQCTSTTGTQYVVKWPTRMRAAPTYATSGTLTAYTVNSQKTTSSHSLLDQTTQGGILSCGASGLSAGNCVDLIAGNDGNAYIEFIAEL